MPGRDPARFLTNFRPRWKQLDKAATTPFEAEAEKNVCFRLLCPGAIIHDVAINALQYTARQSSDIKLLAQLR